MYPEECFPIGLKGGLKISRVTEKILRFSLQRLKGILKSSKIVNKLLYDINNLESFNSLYLHEGMMADAVRVNSYYDAIQHHIKPGDVVLDLGTGTGILSFFAAQKNPKKIYAIDHSDFINVAKQIAEHNKIDDIDFVQTNIRNFQPSEKIDVILHDQIGDNLFDENMIENILDLKVRLLKGTGRILPGKFELFLEPVALKKEYKVPYIWENNICGIDFGFLKNTDKINKYKPSNYRSRAIAASAIDYFLCEPQAILSFDLNELNDTNDITNFLEAQKKVVRSGSMDGLCLFFRVVFDDKINFDTSPLQTHTHWSNRLFRTENRKYQSGEEVSFRMTMEELSNTDTWSITMLDSSAKCNT